jgi:hypothetical protein
VGVSATSKTTVAASTQAEATEKTTSGSKSGA